MSTSILTGRSLHFPPIEPLPPVKPAGGPAGNVAPSSFADVISRSIGTVEQANKSATNAAEQFLSGQNEDVHTVAIAEQKAELTTDLFLQVRNKAISAYQEIMKMQL